MGIEAITGYGCSSYMKALMRVLGAKSCILSLVQLHTCMFDLTKCNDFVKQTS